MAIPRIPEKHSSVSLTSAAIAKDMISERGKYPEAETPASVILCYNPVVFDYLTENYGGAEIPGMPPLSRGTFRLLDGTDGNAAIVGEFGIGSPVTAMVTEHLIEFGVETLLSIGYVGCLQQHVTMDDLLVCTEAIRDEGTSYHYLDHDESVTASPELVSYMTDRFENQDIPYVTGPTWTTDAPLRETRLEVESYQSQGVLSVEMEAAAMYAVADHWDVDAASLFTVSDYVLSDGWDRRFHDTSGDLRYLADTAVDVISTY